MNLTPKLLVVDDDLALARTLVRLLREQGYQASAVSGAESMFDALEGESFDVVMIDTPAMGARGIQAIERLRQDPRWKSLPLLVISALFLDELVARRLGLTRSDYLPKPFRIAELLVRIRGQLRLAHDRDPARFEQRFHSTMADILAEVGSTRRSEEIYQILVRRVAQGLRIPRCSVILAQPGDLVGTVVAAAEDPLLTNLPTDLRRYPDVRQALESGEPVLIENVETDPLFADLRNEWRLSGRTLPVRSLLALRFSVRDTISGVLLLRTTGDERPLGQMDLRFADAVLRPTVSALERAHDLEQQESTRAPALRPSEVDPLTSCADRPALLRRANQIMHHGDATTLVLLALDLDRFARVNEDFDQAFGNRVLRQAANLLRREQRAVDTVARVAEDTFAVLMPDADLPEGRRVAERLLARVAAHDFGDGERGVHLTASIGLAEWSEIRVPDAAALLSLAEHRLHEAKRAGRNRVVA